MSDPNPPRHEITRPTPQPFDPAAANKTPLAALLTALSHVSRPGDVQPPPVDHQPNTDARFTAQLCSALSLRPDSLFSNFQRSRTDQTNSPSQKAELSSFTHRPSLLPLPSIKSEDIAAEHSSAFACNSREDVGVQGVAAEDDETADGGEQENSSNDNNMTSSLRLERLKQEPLSEEAKKRRRQEINRESARRVRKRKSMEHQQLQQQVAALQQAAVSASADQAIMVRYASELTRERDALLQRTAELETKWITAECRNVVLRQKIATMLGVPLQDIAADSGQLLTQTAPLQSNPNVS